ncbi:MAG: bifunctional folylpolyglutamate synthase/dihydrofolate synthase, partial [Nitrospinota bacterium]|nr:bifunctional folylpolyglutamate synthase/dihydrofolate synthase [Nitrospinota bacterium]
MKIKKILNRLLRLHPREIDLSLDRIKRLNHELGNPQNKLKIISITGTNSKYSIAQTIRSILEEAGYSCDLYSSPHVISITERFIFSGKKISDDELCDLLKEVERINKGQNITFFEFLTSCFFLKASRSKSNISIVESGLFNRFDACSAIKQNLMSVISSIGLDHLEWLPENDRNVDRIIFEKTSKLLHSKIVVSE